MHFSTSHGDNLAHLVAPGPARVGAIMGTIQANPQLIALHLASYLVPFGVTSVTASSQFEGLATCSPLWAIAGDPALAWVSNVPGGVGQWIQLNFPRRRWVGTMSIRGRDDGVDPEATRVRLTADGKSLGQRNLYWNANGVALVAVNAFASSLRLTILASQTGRPNSNVGFSEIRISGVGVRRNVAMLDRPVLLVNKHPVGLRIYASSPPPELYGGIPFRSDAEALGFVGYSFTTRVKFGPGTETLEMRPAPLMGVPQLTLAVGKTAPAVIHWLTVHRLDAAHLMARVPPGGGYLLLDETADPLWHAGIRNDALASAGVSNAYGKLWR
ncbi:MAG: hypothetical protein ACYCOU_14505, partial [Sulfobacillus sp.]